MEAGRHRLLPGAGQCLMGLPAIGTCATARRATLWTAGARAARRPRSIATAGADRLPRATTRSGCGESSSPRCEWLPRAPRA